ncbi:hypothetical protein HDU76_004160, partial [Blyttiomyces sp. JEL0837]
MGCCSSKHEDKRPPRPLPSPPKPSKAKKVSNKICDFVKVLDKRKNRDDHKGVTFSAEGDLEIFDDEVHVTGEAPIENVSSAEKAPQAALRGDQTSVGAEATVSAELSVADIVSADDSAVHLLEQSDIIYVSVVEDVAPEVETDVLQPAPTSSFRPRKNKCRRK